MSNRVVELQALNIRNLPIVGHGGRLLFAMVDDDAVRPLLTMEVLEQSGYSFWDARNIANYLASGETEVLNHE